MQVIICLGSIFLQKREEGRDARIFSEHFKIKEREFDHLLVRWSTQTQNLMMTTSWNDAHRDQKGKKEKMCRTFWSSTVEAKGRLWQPAGNCANQRTTFSFFICITRFRWLFFFISFLCLCEKPCQKKGGSRKSIWHLVFALSLSLKFSMAFVSSFARSLNSPRQPEIIIIMTTDDRITAHSFFFFLLHFFLSLLDSFSRSKSLSNQPSSGLRVWKKKKRKDKIKLHSWTPIKVSNKIDVWGTTPKTLLCVVRFLLWTVFFFNWRRRQQQGFDL